MGWNSYDAYGDSVTEQEVLANAEYMKQHLLAHGWRYVVIDFRWYDSEVTLNDNDLARTRTGAVLPADSHGRFLPALNRFPSSANGAGFKPLADRLHAMGLKFGIHVMRGIPRQAVLAKTPIEGSAFTAADAGDPSDHCGWCPDNFGVRNNAAGQAWYDSIFRLYASWGLDFVKVDDLSSPYHAPEIEMIRKAIDRSGRAIVFSTSAGPTDPNQAAHISTHANMWRISGDFWDQWPKLNHQFDLLVRWQGVAGPGHFPDADMIPFGHLSIRNTTNAHERTTRFTPDEQRTLISLWSINASPLMLGMNLPDDDPATTALLTNDEVLAIDQDPLGLNAKRIQQQNGIEVWIKDLKDGSKAIGLFNRGDAAAAATLDWTAANLTGKQTLRDLWLHKNLGAFNQTYSALVPAHGVLLLKSKRK
jgi:alpha-galactosidase